MAISPYLQPTMDVTSLLIYTDLIGKQWFDLLTVFSLSGLLCQFEMFIIFMYIWGCTYFWCHITLLYFSHWLKCVFGKNAAFPKAYSHCFSSTSPNFLCCTSLNTCLLNWNFTIKEVESQRIWICCIWIIVLLGFFFFFFCQSSVYIA